MDYREVEFKDIEKIIDGKRDLGDYGWGYGDRSFNTIKMVTSENGWDVYRVVDADPEYTYGRRRDYYLVSEKHKCYVPISKELWDKEDFQDRLDRAIGKQQVYQATALLRNKKDGHTTRRKELVSAANPTDAKKRAIEDFRASRRSWSLTPPSEWDIDQKSIKIEFKHSEKPYDPSDPVLS